MMMQRSCKSCLLTNNVKKFGFLQDRKNQEIFPFYAVLKYSDVSQSHTHLLVFCHCNLISCFQFLAFLRTLKLQIIVNLFPIPPPPFYFVLAIGRCFTYHFYKAGLPPFSFFFFVFI